MRILACAEEEILSLFVMAVASLLELLFILSASSPLIYPHYTCMYLFSVSKENRLRLHIESKFLSSSTMYTSESLS